MFQGYYGYSAFGGGFGFIASGVTFTNGYSYGQNFYSPWGYYGH